MESPALVGIPDDEPLHLWRLLLALILLLGSGVGLSLVLRLITFPIPCMGGFLLLHWLIPSTVSVLGLAWAVRRWRNPDRRRSSFWGALILAALQIAGLLSWFNWRRNMRELNQGVYSSRVEYVALADRPVDWLDPARPQVYELGAGLRLALSPVIWTDGLHRSLPRSLAPDLEPYPESGDPKPLSEQGQRNLIALMKATALIRFFHPTDAAQFSDWGRLISQGVRQVEDASTPEELAKRLHRLLAPYAPTARFLLSGESPSTIPVPEGARLLGRWRHVGIGFECVHQGFTGSTKDRSARLAGVGMAWTTFQHFYPYWDVVGVDWEAVLPVSLHEAATAPTHEAYYKAIRHLSSQLKDGHAWPGDYAAPMMGFPDVTLKMIDHHPLVAARWGLETGLPLGAEVVSVNGEPAGQVLTRRREECSGPTPDTLEDAAAYQLLMAPPKTTLRVEVVDLAGRHSTHDIITRRPQSRLVRPEAIRELNDHRLKPVG